MCGLNGMIAFHHAPPLSREALISMRETMFHRGPDGSGIWVDEQKRVAFAHRRLSILDLAEFASQPMMDHAQSVIVVFNGEIYNHAELRQDLVNRGFEFKTSSSDTEILLHGYKAWGWEELLQRLRGMFAIALWDINKRNLYLGRDRLGIKPLYIQKTAKGVLFASEIKAILKLSSEPREVDAFAMYHYLSGMVTPAPMTMFRGIQKVPPATYVLIRENGDMSSHSYWHPAKTAPQPFLKSRDDAVEYIRFLFTSSVHEQMEADVPVGVLLSGGVDSTSLLATMARRASRPVKTFSVGYDGNPEIDERLKAQKIAQHYGAEHHEVVISEDTLKNSWENIVFHQDEPLADWVCFPLYHVSKLAAADVKVVIVGEGADELFAGYDGYLRYLRLHKQYWKPYQHFVPHWARQILSSMAESVAERRITGASGLDFFIRASRDRECFWGGAVTFWESQKRNLLTPEFYNHAHKRLNNGLDDGALQVMDSYAVMALAAKTLVRPTTQLTRMINLELQNRLPELLLMRVDKMTMAHALEARVPFLDHRLVETVFDLPEEWKIVNGCPKSLFKDAVRGLIPDEVIDRPKTGFGAPVSQWLKGDLGKIAEEEILNCPLINAGWFNQEYIRKLFKAHRNGLGDFAVCLWTLYNLATWYRLWISKNV